MCKIVQRSKVFKKMTKKDYIIAIIIIFLYAIVAFVGLGDTKAPSTGVELEKGDTIQIQFNQKVNVSMIRHYNGWVEDCDYRIKTGTKKDAWKYDSNNTKTENGDSSKETYRLGNSFSWESWLIDKEAKYIEIELLSEKSEIKEFVILDDEKNRVEPKSIKINEKKVRELGDEQKLFPGKSSYRQNPYFDEHLYVRTAYDFMNGLESFEWTHPPLGKCFIALGIKIFGMCPFGWRFIGTLFGVLMLPVVYVFAKKVFDKTWCATLACGFLALDFMHFTQTRIATLDVYVTMFIILMYYFMYMYYEISFYDTKLSKTLLLLVGAGVSMGASIACKWTGCYAVIGIALLFFMTIYKRIREYNIAKKDETGSSDGIEHSYIIKVFRPYIVKTLVVSAVVFMLVPIIIYTASYIPFREVDNIDASIVERMVNNQKDIFEFHTKNTQVNTESSRWYTWPLVLKPVRYYTGWVSGTHRESINAMGNPIIWWTGIVSFVYMLYRIIRKRDKTAWFIVIGYLSQYLPWIFIARMTFMYHYFTSIPFVVLMNVYMFRCLLGDKPSKKKKIYLMSYVLSVGIVFVMFYPVISGQTVSANYVQYLLEWLPNWALIQ